MDAGIEGPGEGDLAAGHEEEGPVRRQLRGLPPASKVGYERGQKPWGPAGAGGLGRRPAGGARAQRLRCVGRGSPRGAGLREHRPGDRLSPRCGSPANRAPQEEGLDREAQLARKEVCIDRMNALSTQLH